MPRELRGFLGIAVLASVFVRNGGYTSPHVFVEGFTDALWVAVGLSAAAVVAALLAPGRTRTHEGNAIALHGPVLSEEGA